ncbi:MAG: adenosylcobalamin-dependent ribonucleoside-diphosphate reductase [Paludibacteraceae bacterium]|nr:adenosylcobalamin-dependent ribonucleoside-diphosphate reductase [Paludibacteraceae bacterium]MBR5972559.1 adenosylcobalamin-dependent ribonucleoside-diphosphate reductase [Paludibacteraceae bacterium]
MDGQVYTYEEAYNASLLYFKGDSLAARMWVSKYALKDSLGNIFEKDPEDMHRRMANEIARIEGKYSNPMTSSEVFGLFSNFRYLVPQGSLMSGIGNKYQTVSLSNNFVVGRDEDAESFGAIVKSDEEQIQLMKRGGGVGHDMSGLFPRGMRVKNSTLTSVGLTPFMERYSNSTREVEQEGRKGSLGLSVSIKHPDVETFIETKMTERKMNSVDVAVRVDDEFMKSAERGTPYIQRFPVESDYTNLKKEVSASDLWKKITHNVWKSSGLRILFWDTIIRESVSDCYADLGFKTVSVSPYGGIPLSSYDSCRQMSINLFSYVKNPFEREAQFDFDLLRLHVRKMQRVMDDVVDLEIEAIDRILKEVDADSESNDVKQTERQLWDKIKEKLIKGRRTGLGTTAEGDMLAAMGLTYGTPEAVYFSEQVHQTIALETYRSSVDLAEERGSFSMYDAGKEASNPFINRIKVADVALYDRMTKVGRRNVACLTVSPTGVTSLMSQTTPGMEPVYMPVEKRLCKVNPNDTDVHVDFVDDIGDSYEEHVVYHPKFLTWMQTKGYDVKNHYSQMELDHLVMESPYYKASARDIDWMDKVRMQGRIQKWIDHSICLTIQVPESTTEETIGQLCEEAWRCGCKGLSIYREGSCCDGAESFDSTERRQGSAEKSFRVEPRPKELDADVVRFQNNKEKWIAFVGLLNGRPYEIFTGLADDEDGLLIPKTVENGRIIRNFDEKTGKSRYDFQYSNRRGYKTTIEGLSYKFNPEYWNYAKLISGVLRYGMPLDQVVKLVGGLQLNSETINNWKIGVERSLKKYIPNGTEQKGVVCEKCGQTTVRNQEGCLICANCGFSKYEV